jgi:HD superfamily phosphohydrolase
MIFPDVIHQEIWMDEDYLDLVRTQSFQRLLGLKQQGNTYFRFPRATHNRFQHSIGVYENMKRMLHHLTFNRNMPFTTYELKLASMSALLHDIGHGPFSHCFEYISGIHHEMWTKRIIEEDEEISHILSRTPNLLSDVVSIISKSGEYELIENLLSSELGADRLDYQLRDLFYSELNAEPFDLTAIINEMDVFKNKLVINMEAISGIERLIHTKRELFEQGFNHPSVIGKDVLMQLIFQRAEYLLNQGRLGEVPSFLLPLLDKSESWNVEQYVQLDDKVIYNLILHWCENEDDLLSRLTKSYMNSNEDFIHWIEVDEHLNYQVQLQEFTYGFFSQNARYGRYKSGILVNDSGSISDVFEKSEMIRQLSSLEAKHFLFSISPIHSSIERG